MSEDSSEGDSGSDHWQAELYENKHSFVWKLADGAVELLDPQPHERAIAVALSQNHRSRSILQVPL